MNLTRVCAVSVAMRMNMTAGMALLLSQVLNLILASVLGMGRLNLRCDYCFEFRNNLIKHWFDLVDVLVESR